MYIYIYRCVFVVAYMCVYSFVCNGPMGLGGTGFSEHCPAFCFGMKYNCYIWYNILYMKRFNYKTRKSSTIFVGFNNL